MYREDTQTGSVIGTNTLYSQIQRNVSLNDIHINENEDAANVQDNNIARVFDYFLRSYVQQETYESEEDEDLEETVKDMFRYAKDRTKVIYYMKVACQLVLKESNSTEVLQVHLGHIMNWRYDDPDAPPNLNVQLYRYLVKNFLRMQEPLEDVVQFLANELSNAFSRVPRKFYVQFLHEPTLVYPLKELKCNMLGELVCVRGQVTRVSDVKPELVRATFKCKTCGTVVGDVVQQFKYTTPTKCPSNNCLNSTDWELMMDHSFFCDWQKIRIQEVAQEAESGSMPCSMEVILRNKLVDTVNAGDRVQVSGSLIVVPDIPSMLNATQLGEVAKKVMRQGAKRFESFLLSQGITGIKGVGAKQLNHKLCFLATQVIVINQARSSPQFTEIEDKSFIAEDLLSIPGFEWIREVSRSRDTIDRLSKIIAPNVWGNYEIKKGLLLLLVGGVHKSSRDAKLRGDINMCIVGDPSTAKSQFLKFVESFAPRAVYTSGKGSTAAGLTAAVFRDRDNNDYVLEAGALMYADEGICCIDEFDKMNERDRVSIHEAMEQQTISISKAGIQATLNARASVLAACNPRYGRYDTSKSFKENVNIPSPLLSRFDLLYTILDENNNQVNRQISEYVCNRYNQYTAKSSPQVVDLNLEREEERRRRARENMEMELEGEEVEPVEVDYYKLSKWDEYTSPNYVNPNRRFATTNRVGKEGSNESGANGNTESASRRGGESQQESNVGEAEEEMTLDELRLYIELCKRLKPLMQDSAKHKLSDYYIELRNGDVGGGRRSMRMTVRQLESLVRLSEAVAKLKFSDFVTDEHVQIAYGVFKSSLLKLTNKSSVKLTFGNETARSSMETERSASAEETQEGASARRHGGEARAEDSELVSTIGLDLYNDISAVLLDKVSESELRGSLLANNELVEWYLEEVLLPRNEAEANEWNLKLQQIVHRLAFVDSKLLPSQLEGDPENIYRLRVHPNYFSHTHLFSRKQDQYAAKEGEAEQEEFMDEDEPEETERESQVSQQD